MLELELALELVCTGVVVVVERLVAILFFAAAPDEADAALSVGFPFALPFAFPFAFAFLSFRFPFGSGVLVFVTFAIPFGVAALASAAMVSVCSAEISGISMPNSLQIVTMA